MGTPRQGITVMDAMKLRTRQSPLKARYRTEPASALVALRAEGALDVEALQCRVNTRGGVVPAGLHVADPPRSRHLDAHPAPGRLLQTLRHPPDIASVARAGLS